MIAPTPLTAISYVFDDLTVCDERSYIQLLVDRWGLRPVHIPCDDAWPFKEMDRWPYNPNFPEANAYRLLKERAYQRASDEGLRVLMPGVFGDELYCGEEDWLFDLVVDGHLWHAGQELWRHIYYLSLRRTINSSYVRRALRRLANLVPGVRPRKRAVSPPVWLRSEAADRLYKHEDWLDPAFDRKSRLLGLGASKSSAYENINGSRHALELRHPYHDRRLVEYVLSLPAYQLYNLGYYKYILRVAMKGILPDPILSRSQSTFLSPLFMRGAELENQELRRVFHDPGAAWREYVRADWLAQYLGEEMLPKDDGPSAVVVWLCVAYEHWLRGYF
jgi:asparagine synthase (glutamine-hydrolysing)